MTQSWKSLEGQVVAGKFELCGFLGSSVNSGVFLTECEGQRAAIKLVPTHPDQAKAQVARLARAASLSHPNLLRLFESGRCRLGNVDLVYAVMEYADENLSEILPQRALTQAEVSEMLPPILEALGYLHGRGLAQGRIKPSNIFAVGERVKISSDGVCANGDAPTWSTEYDAPEVATAGCAAAADMWALGMTLVETLTRERPQWQRKDENDPEVPPALPQPLFDIARNCLRRDPQRRWNVVDICATLRLSSRAPEVQASETPQTIPGKRPEEPVRATAEERVIGSPAAQVRRASQVIRPRPKARWRHLVPAAALALVAAIIIVVAPRLFNRSQGRSGEVSAGEPLAASSDESARPEATGATKPGVMKAPPVSVSAARPGTAGGGVIYQALPNVPQNALETIRGTVKVGVRVQVDPFGDVTEASLESAGPSKYFAGLAMNAAREWKFASAAADAATREWLLRFEFTPDGTRAFPAPMRQ